MILSLKPPYHISTKTLALVAEIAEKSGAVKIIHKAGLEPRLRRKNQVRTIQASLEIEGNSLSEAQVTAILDGRRVAGPAKDILEVQNANAAYSILNELDPYSQEDFLKAHEKLMFGLTERPGAFRTGSVGITKGSQLTHVAPAGTMVHGLMKGLFDYLRREGEIPLIKSCVFHCELEFIQPFADGNGRMGRLWQTAILSKHNMIFAAVPFESLIRERQQAYYDALGQSDKQGQSTPFIEFMLSVISQSLDEFLHMRPQTADSSARMGTFLKEQGRDLFSRKDYLRFYPNLAPATASRDLKQATAQGVLDKLGDKRTTQYRSA